MRKDLISIYEYDLNSYLENSLKYNDNISLVQVNNFMYLKSYLSIVRESFNMSLIYFSACFLDILWEMIFDCGIKNYLLKNQDDIIGTVSIEKTTHRNSSNSVVLYNFSISKKYRGKKLSYDALNSILNFLRLNDYKYIRLKVKRTNAPAVRVYSALGFVEMED